MAEKEQQNVVMEVTVILGDKRKKVYKVFHEDLKRLPPLVAFFQNHILELSRGKKCLYYYHERKHKSIDLTTKYYEPVEDFYELEGLVVDFEKGEVYEFLDLDEGYTGEGYMVFHKNFTAIAYYGFGWGNPPIKCLFIRKARKI